jgi:hypothetical protein
MKVAEPGPRRIISTMPAVSDETDVVFLNPVLSADRRPYSAATLAEAGADHELALIRSAMVTRARPPRTSQQGFDNLDDLLKRSCPLCYHQQGRVSTNRPR